MSRGLGDVYKRQVVYSALFVFLVFKFVMSEYEVNTLKREVKKVFKKV